MVWRSIPDPAIAGSPTNRRRISLRVVFCNKVVTECDYVSMNGFNAMNDILRSAGQMYQDIDASEMGGPYSFTGKVVSVLGPFVDKPTISVMEEFSTRSAVVCHSGRNLWSQVQTLVGKVVDVTGMPIYDSSGKLLRVEDCEFFIR